MSIIKFLREFIVGAKKEDTMSSQNVIQTPVQMELLQLVVQSDLKKKF